MFIATIKLYKIIQNTNSQFNLLFGLPKRYLIYVYTLHINLYQFVKHNALSSTIPCMSQAEGIAVSALISYYKLYAAQTQVALDSASLVLGGGWVN